MKKTLNITLFICFLLTVMAPITGIQMHKIVATLFLLLSIIHTILYRKNLNIYKYLFLILITISFASGLFGMIFSQVPVLLTLHYISSIAVIFFSAIHVFVSTKQLLLKQKHKKTR